jgi:hypothetical protein
MFREVQTMKKQIQEKAILISITIIAVAIIISANIISSSRQLKNSEISSSVVTTTSEKKCPLSCDDGNKCTIDYCSPATNYECKHEEIRPCCGNGICETGESFQSCPDDCPLTYKIGNGICEPGEINAIYGMGCIDCISACNNDHTEMCVGQKYGIGERTTISYTCQKTSIMLDSRGFYVPTGWETRVSMLGPYEFKITGNDGLITLLVSMYFPSDEFSWKANKWETYLSNIHSQITCYKPDGSYALQEGETYNGVQLKDFFTCDASHESLACEPIGNDLESVKKLGSYYDNKFSKSTIYNVLFYSYGITRKPFTLNCKSKIWSEDIPYDVKEITFTVHFV